MVSTQKIDKKMLLVTKSDLLELIEQSENTISEKSEMERLIELSDEYVVESDTEGVKVSLPTNQSFVIKNISMNQFFNNKN